MNHWHRQEKKFELVAVFNRYYVARTAAIYPLHPVTKRIFTRCLFYINSLKKAKKSRGSEVILEEKEGVEVNFLFLNKSVMKNILKVYVSWENIEKMLKNCYLGDKKGEN